jgi:hypothetical protein
LTRAIFETLELRTLLSTYTVTTAAGSGRRIITIEDNYTGGLDAELAMQIAKKGTDIKLKALFVHHIPKSGRNCLESVWQRPEQRDGLSSLPASSIRSIPPVPARAAAGGFFHIDCGLRWA